MKKSLIISTAVAAFLAAPALAADLPARMPVKAPVYVAPVVTWTGWYVGANVGYSWGRADKNFNMPNLPEYDHYSYEGNLKPNGVIGGVQFGYKYQVSPTWLLGWETDFQGSAQKASKTTTENIVRHVVDGNDYEADGTITTSLQEKLQWFGTLRGTVGVFLTPSILLYGTGGLAYGDVKFSTTIHQVGTYNDGGSKNVNSTASFSDSNTKVGLAGGGGIEGLFPNAPRWTWKVEYLHLDLGTIDHSFSSAATGAFVVHNKFTDDIVRVGVNYRFDWGKAPVVSAAW
jgi:outer membrane immunogenic protein